MISVSFLVWEELTFFTSKAFSMASFMCFSHIPHIMPSMFRTVFVMLITPFDSGDIDLTAIV